MKATREDVRRLFGDLEEHTIVEILATGASVEELEAVVVHLAPWTDVPGDPRRPLSGPALELFERLRRERRERGG